MQATSWPLPGTGKSTNHSPWRSWCLITPKLYVVPLLYSACVYSVIIGIDYYRDLQWFVDIATDAGELPISPLNDFNVRASWGNDVVTVSDSLGSLWTVKETNNGYTYVTSTSWPYFPSSFPLVVSRMAVSVLSGVLPHTRQARR